ncbi:MAG: glycoside hydrolase family 3 C-terminal domain-containing protein [Clostridiales bacterium]|nr:glycoside hydrolase family 3 C-terminal domain-containing protein [Clostridiales bacterium]
MDIDLALKNMPLEDKARLICGRSPFSIGGMECEGTDIPVLYIQDGGTGINFEQLFQDRQDGETEGFSAEEIRRVTTLFYHTDELTVHENLLREKISRRLSEIKGNISSAPGCYPPGILLGASWNPDVVHEVSCALGMEAQVYKIGILLGTPNCNLLRDPRNGRFFEGYSEDPCLAKILAPQMCKGVEEAGVASNAKHFACNNLEINRVGIDEKIPQRAIEELYLPAFEECAKVSSVFMSAYVSVNGSKCTENRWLLTEVLRDRWGFDGAVVTDWAACTGKAGDSLAAGNDLFMPGPWDHTDIVAAVKDGRVPEERLDEACRRVLELISRHSGVSVPEGFTDEEYVSKGRKAAYDAACEGIVMLINKGAFPLKEGGVTVFFGRSKGRFRDYGTGSAQVFTDRTTVLPDELSKIPGFEKIAFDDLEAYRNGATAVVIETMDSSEGADRKDLKLSDETCSLIDELKSAGGSGRICLILNTPGPVELGGYKDCLDGLFAVFYPGMEGGRAMADILTGKVNPSGHLPVTFPERLEDVPSFLSYPDSFSCVYGEGIYAGYRGYQKRKIKPLFPFGYGLSYTDFEIVKMASEVNDGRVCNIVTVKNSGSRAGKVTLQIYSHKVRADVPRPENELRAFGKFFLEAGETKTAELSFDTSELRYFDADRGTFLLEEGAYEIRCGFDCEDLKASSQIRIDDGSPELKCGISWPCGKIAQHPELEAALKKDVETKGDSYGLYLSDCIYMPFKPVSEIYPGAAGYVEFLAACRSFRHE